MRIPNGSNILVVPFGSGLNIATTTSGNPINLAGFYGAMVIATTASNGGGTTGTIYKVVRSSTSNGTYNPFGMTLSAISTGSMGATVVRNFLVNTSATWHRVVVNNGAGGSVAPIGFLLGMKGPYEPIGTQSTLVTVQSDVLVG